MSEDRSQWSIHTLVESSKNFLLEVIYCEKGRRLLTDTNGISIGSENLLDGQVSNNDVLLALDKPDKQLVSLYV
jgi:hypothetical protein